MAEIPRYRLFSGDRLDTSIDPAAANRIVTARESFDGQAALTVQSEPLNDRLAVQDLYSGATTYQLGFYSDGGIESRAFSGDNGLSDLPSNRLALEVELIGVDNTAGPPGDRNDDLRGTASSDSEKLLSGDDRYLALAGDDIAFGNRGNDKIFGNQGADSLYGGQGDDTLYGGQGNDVLSGDLGDDVLSGDLGADRYVFGQNAGRDTILGFSQAQGDRLDLQGQSYTAGAAADGNALLTLSGGGTVELTGISQANFGTGAGFVV